ncbi:hypothetical protein SAMN04488136_109150 [Vibrio xiamenensis]|uniref:Uncharacterized protein n=1 Tax=Vibrio xiamenensis TaxID=861298 RepID=A0A1G8A561_9VIBR|nr:hypothetical protein SAMN04488136_109150 [Vibrio xiamenensis]
MNIMNNVIIEEVKWQSSPITSVYWGSHSRRAFWHTPYPITLDIRKVLTHIINHSHLLISNLSIYKHPFTLLVQFTIYSPPLIKVSIDEPLRTNL